MEEKVRVFIEEKAKKEYEKHNAIYVRVYEDFKDVIQWYEVDFDWFWDIMALHGWMSEAPFYAIELGERVIWYASEGIGQKIILCSEGRIEDPDDPDETIWHGYVAMIDSKEDIIRFYEKIAQIVNK